jgi:hypothetical protein
VRLNVEASGTGACTEHTDELLSLIKEHG